VAVTLAAWMAASGCTSLREIPRKDYGAVPERKDVRLDTMEGLHYELDYVRIDGDTLTGYRRRDSEGLVDDFAMLRVALDDVKSLSARRIDWARTSLIGAGAAAAVVAAGLKNNKSPDSGGSGDGGGGGGGGRVP
jgi:hypothetical protein